MASNSRELARRLRLGSSGWFFVDSGLVEVYKTECTPTGSPFRNGPLHRLADLEEATAAWVHWYNNHRLMHRLGRRPPVEYEALYHAKTRDGQPADHT